MSTNDITGDSLKTKPASDAYRDGYDRIFGKKKSADGNWPTPESEVMFKNWEPIPDLPGCYREKPKDQQVRIPKTVEERARLDRLAASYQEHMRLMRIVWDLPNRRQDSELTAVELEARNMARELTKDGWKAPK